MEAILLYIHSYIKIADHHWPSEMRGHVCLEEKQIACKTVMRKALTSVTLPHTASIEWNEQNWVLDSIRQPAVQ